MARLVHRHQDRAVEVAGGSGDARAQAVELGRWIGQEAGLTRADGIGTGLEQGQAGVVADAWRDLASQRRLLAAEAGPSEGFHGGEALGHRLAGGQTGAARPEGDVLQPAADDLSGIGYVQHAVPGDRVEHQFRREEHARGLVRAVAVGGRRFGRRLARRRVRRRPHGSDDRGVERFEAEHAAAAVLAQCHVSREQQDGGADPFVTQKAARLDARLAFDLGGVRQHGCPSGAPHEARLVDARPDAAEEDRGQAEQVGRAVAQRGRTQLLAILRQRRALRTVPRDGARGRRVLVRRGGGFRGAGIGEGPGGRAVPGEDGFLYHRFDGNGVALPVIELGQQAGAGLEGGVLVGEPVLAGGDQLAQGGPGARMGREVKMDHAPHQGAPFDCLCVAQDCPGVGGGGIDAAADRQLLGVEHHDRPALDRAGLGVADGEVARGFVGALAVEQDEARGAVLLATVAVAALGGARAGPLGSTADIERCQLEPGRPAGTACHAPDPLGLGHGQVAAGGDQGTVPGDHGVRVEHRAGPEMVAVAPGGSYHQGKVGDGRESGEFGREVQVTLGYLGRVDRDVDAEAKEAGQDAVASHGVEAGADGHGVGGDGNVGARSGQIDSRPLQRSAVGVAGLVRAAGAAVADQVGLRDQVGRRGGLILLRGPVDGRFDGVKMRLAAVPRALRGAVGCAECRLARRGSLFLVGECPAS